MSMHSPEMLVLRGGLVLDGVSAEAVSADILVDKGRITELVQPGFDVPEQAQEIRADNRLIIPGLINGHSHSHLAWAKGISKSWTLEMHLHNGPWTGGGQNLQDRRLFARFAAAEMLLKGVTACYDLVLELPAPTPEGLFETAAGYLDAGMRAVVAPMMADRTFWRAIPGLMDALPQDLRGVVEQIKASGRDLALSACEEAVKNWPYRRDFVMPALAPTIPLHCSDDFWLGCRDLAENYGLGVHAHIAESRIQAVSGARVYGKSLVEHIDSLGVINQRFTAAHAIWLEPSDLDILAARGASVVHNPSSNFRLGSGIADVQAMRSAGIPVGLGSDACSCSDHQNLFEVIRLACYISRTRSFDPDAWLTPRDVLEMATAGSARALGMQGQIGKIAPGYAADMVLLDLDGITYTPLNDPLYQLVFGEEGRAVDRVMVGGRTVVEDGRLTCLDLEALSEQVRDRVAEIQANNASSRTALGALEPFVKHFCVGLAQRN